MEDAHQILPNTGEKVQRSITMEDAKQILYKTGEKLGEGFEKIRRTTMNASEKMQSCFDARLASMITGIFMSVISGALVLCSIGGLIYVFVIVAMGYDLSLMPHNYDRPFRIYQVTDIMIVNVIITASLILSLLEFSFSVVLAEGASKRKSGQLRAYFIYGNIRSVIAFIVSIVLYIVSWDNLPGNITLFLCGLSVVLNILVYMAYKNMKSSSKKYNNIEDEAMVQG